ncbi:polysaccharide deacetylase family protein [bacterium]|nr:polysaccharide deacetylase family protein [bacterium]
MLRRGREFLFFFLAVFFASRAFAFSLPVLCYHQVKPKAKGKFEISTEAFFEQLKTLKSRGYKAINSHKLIDFLSGRTSFPSKPVVVSFDDGYKNVFTNAFPIMQKFDFVGVVCVYPKFIGSGNAMSWENLKELALAGWTIECHTFSHRNMGDLPSSLDKRKAVLQDEISRPKQLIEKAIGKPVLFITWPYGVYTEETERFAKKAGYLGAFTVDGGANYPNIDPFRVKRQVIYGSDNLAKFLIRLEMESLPLEGCVPAPGKVLSSLKEIECTIPGMENEKLENYVLNVKITGGKLKFGASSRPSKVWASPAGALSYGPHFIDVYLRDKRTGVTKQNGWFFTLRP